MPTAASGAAGTPGYDASVDYVVDRLEAAGWNVELDEFQFIFVAAADSAAADAGERHVRNRRVHRHGHGDVTGNVIPVDINLTPPRGPPAAARPPTSPGSSRPATSR